MGAPGTVVLATFHLDGPHRVPARLHALARGVIAEAADNNVHRRAAQVAAEVGEQLGEGLFVGRGESGLGVAFTLHPAQRDRGEGRMPGLQLLEFGEDLLVINRALLVALFELRGGGDPVPLRQPAADGLAHYAVLDADHLGARQRRLRLRQEVGRGIQVRHVGLPRKDEQMHRFLRRGKVSGQQKKNGGGQAGKESESFHDPKFGHLMECMTEEGKASVEHHSNRNPNPSAGCCISTNERHRPAASA